MGMSNIIPTELKYQPETLDSQREKGDSNHKKTSSMFENKSNDMISPQINMSSSGLFNQMSGFSFPIVPNQGAGASLFSDMSKGQAVSNNPQGPTESINKTVKNIYVFFINKKRMINCNIILGCLSKY